MTVYIKCETCNGAGTFRCEECLCKTCKGTGKIKCTDCDDGKIKCSKCERGRIECNYCGGYGQITKDGRFSTTLVMCPDCSGSKKIDCFYCSGSGLLACSSCRGTGGIECSSCDSLGTSNDCPYCSETKTIACGDCGGKGKLIKVGENISPEIQQNIPPRTTPTNYEPQASGSFVSSEITQQKSRKKTWIIVASVGVISLGVLMIFIIDVLISPRPSVYNESLSASSSGCGSGSLTTPCAQKTVDRAMEIVRDKLGNLITPNARAVVQGVQEIPQQNMAQADVTFIDTVAGSRNCFGMRYRWNNGVAIFKRYTDGRWVMTHLQTGEIMCGGTWTFNNLEVR